MKRIYTILASLLLANVALSQASAALPITYITPSKDTLFVQDDSMGKLIKDIWMGDKNYKGKKPVIIMVPNLNAFLMERKKVKLRKK
jgi:hypothetical protein